MFGEVGAGVEHDQRADAGDEQGEEQRQAVEPEGELDPERRHPGEGRLDDAAACHGRHLGQEMNEGSQRRECKQPARALIQAGSQRHRGQHRECDQADAGEHGLPRWAVVKMESPE